MFEVQSNVGLVAKPHWQYIHVHMLVFLLSLQLCTFVACARCMNVHVCVCLCAQMCSVYIFVCVRAESAVTAGGCAPQIAAWLIVRGASCVVRLMRLCIDYGCWVTEMMYESRMDSQLGENIRLGTKGLSQTYAESITHMPNMHIHIFTLTLNNPKQSPESWKEAGHFSVVVEELKGFLT